MWIEKDVFVKGCEKMYETILPPPLGKEEQEVYLTRLKNGDSEARGILIEGNLRLVVYIAGKYQNTGIDFNDLTSIGNIGLIKAVDTFDLEKGYELATYSSRCIENEILMYLRRAKKSRAEISLDMPINTDVDGNELVLADVLSDRTVDIEHDIIRQQLVEKLPEILKKLSARDRTIIEKRFGINGRVVKTQKEVAIELGISQSYISRLERRALKKLQKGFKPDELNLLLDALCASDRNISAGYVGPIYSQVYNGSHKTRTEESGGAVEIGTSKKASRKTGRNSDKNKKNLCTGRMLDKKEVETNIGQSGCQKPVDIKRDLQKKPAAEANNAGIAEEKPKEGLTHRTWTSLVLRLMNETDYYCVPAEILKELTIGKGQPIRLTAAGDRVIISLENQNDSIIYENGKVFLRKQLVEQR